MPSLKAVTTQNLILVNHKFTISDLQPLPLHGPSPPVLLLTQIYYPCPAVLSTKSHPCLKISPAQTVEFYSNSPISPGAEIQDSPLISMGAEFDMPQDEVLPINRSQCSWCVFYLCFQQLQVGSQRPLYRTSARSGKATSPFLRAFTNTPANHTNSRCSRKLRTTKSNLVKTISF